MTKIKFEKKIRSKQNTTKGIQNITIDTKE